jgi:tetratricopeptide (TPR) repeat protein
MTEESKYTLEEAHVEFAKKTNGMVWKLLGQSDRTDLDNQKMELAAFASLFHWMHAGTAVHHQRGEWLIAHVYTVLGQKEPAKKHAHRCLELTEKNMDQMADFDLAYAYEGVARAEALAGNAEEAKQYLKLATEAGEKIEDEESKGIFVGDLESGDWYGVK